MNKRLLLLLGITVIASNPSSAQFQEAIGNAQSQYARSVQYDIPDKGYILAGYTGAADANLTKTDNAGNFLWSKTYGSTGKDLFNSVRVVTGPTVNPVKYVAAGRTTSFGAGNYDFFLVGTDNLGNPLFTQTFGRTGSDVAYQVQVIRDQFQQPGYVLVGETGSYPAIYPGTNIYVVKTDINGNYTDAVVVGTPFTEVGYAIEQTRDGGYLIAGYTTAKTPADSVSNKNIYVVKLNATLNVVWSRIFSGPGDREDVAYSIKENLINNTIIVTGSTRSFGNGEESFLLNLSPAGAVNWFKVYGAYKDERAQSILITKDATGNPEYAVAGYTNSYNSTSNPDVLFYKTRLDGTLIWSRTYGGQATDYAFELAGNFTGAAHEYALGGYTNSFGAGAFDKLLIETNNDGKSGSHCERVIDQKEVRYNPYISANAQNVHVKDYKQYQTPFIKRDYKVNYCLTPSAREEAGIEEAVEESSSLIVKPVPAQTNLIVEFSDDYEGGTLTIINSQGSVVQTGTLSSGNISLDVTGLPSGIYILHVTKSDGKVASTRFIKE